MVKGHFGGAGAASSGHREELIALWAVQGAFSELGQCKSELATVRERADRVSRQVVSVEVPLTGREQLALF